MGPVPLAQFVAHINLASLFRFDRDLYDWDMETGLKDSNEVNLYDLYTSAFQKPAKDMRFLADSFGDRFGKAPRSLREDFCGSFANSLEWLRIHRDNTATGIDVDDDLIRYGRSFLEKASRNIQQRFTLIHGDVSSIELPSADVVATLNSSFCEIRDRARLKHYLSECSMTLANPGLLALELYCGAEAQTVGCDEISVGEFTTIWEQAEFDPVTNYCLNHIHFRFKDGSKIERAFSYEWRLWSPAECIDILDEVGFKTVTTKVKTDVHGSTDTSPTLFILAFKD